MAGTISGVADDHVVFQGNSLAWLGLMARICQPFEMADLCFKLAIDVLEVLALDHAHVVFARCRVPAAAFRHYDISQDQELLISKDHFCDLPNELLSTPADISLAILSGDNGEIVITTNGYSSTIPARRPSIEQSKAILDARDFVADIIENQYTTDACTLSLTSSAMKSLSMHAGRLLDAIQASNARPYDILDPRITAGPKHLLKMVASEGLEAVRVHDWAGSTGKARLESCSLMAFRRGGPENRMHELKGYAESFFDPRFFTFLRSFDINAMKGDPHQLGSEQSSSHPFTILVGHQKPCVFRISISGATITYAIAPHEEELLDADAGDDALLDRDMLLDDEGDLGNWHEAVTHGASIPRQMAKWATFIDDDYYLVRKSDFVAHYEKYIDPECWELGRIEGAKHLISKHAVMTRVPWIRGCISLVDASFALCLYKNDGYRKLRTVGCRHLVLNHESKGMSFQRLPFVQAVIATANTFAQGNFDAFSPRILIDSIGSNDNAKTFVGEIMRSLVKDMADSYDIYKRVYYFSYIVYLVDHLSQLDGIPVNDHPSGVERHVFPVLAPDREGARRALRDHEPLPNQCLVALDALGQQDEALLPATYAKFLASKSTIAELLDIAELLYFHDDIFQQVLIDTILNGAEKTRLALHPVPCDLAQAATMVHALDPNTLRGFIALFHQELETAAAAIDAANIVDPRVARLATMSKHGRDNIDTATMYDDSSCHAMQARALEATSARLATAIKCFNAASLAIGEDASRVARRTCPTMLLPAIDLYDRLIGTPRELFAKAASEPIALLRSAIELLVGNDILRLLKGANPIGIPMRTRDEWRRDYPGARFDIPDEEVDALLSIETEIGEPIPHVDDLLEESFGFYIDGGHVVGLGFYKKGLRVLPEAVTCLRKLVFLRLMKNQLLLLPDAIGSLEALVELDLRDNKLVELPGCIGELRHLGLLDLGGNALAYIPESIGKLVNLVALSLSFNHLTSLPDSIGMLRNLDRFKLYDNQLVTIPATIGKLASLRWLGLAHNDLTILPDEVGCIPRLEILDLQSNSLAELPETITGLTKLVELRLYDNNLGHFPENIGKWLDGLKSNGSKVLNAMPGPEGDPDDE
jgi:hypothetical protein